MASGGRRVLPVSVVVALSACGGGGGGGGAPQQTPVPTVSLSATPASVVAGGTAQLTWTVSNASSCTASGGWTGSRGTSGTEQVAPTADTTYTLTCGSASDSVSITVTAPTATLSGQLLIAPTTQTDSDTNDAMLIPVPNDTAASAQPLPNPVILGGYAALPGAGQSGPLQDSGDADDYYRVNLLAGQIIELYVADAEAGVHDLDLALIELPSHVLVDESFDVGPIEQLTVPASGEYLVHVHAYAGASNYVLTIGQTGTMSAPAGLKLSSDFEPGQLLVKPRAGSAAWAMNGGTAETKRMHSSLADSYALEIANAAVGADFAPGSFMVMKLTSDTMSALSNRRPRFRAAADSGLAFVGDEARRKWETLQALKAVAADPGVEWAEPNWIWRSYSVPNDPLYVRQRWHYELINLPAAWDLTVGSPGVVAAVVDTGVRPHSELFSRLVSGIDFVNPAYSGDGDGDDLDASDPGVPTPGAYSFHGTHVAGTIGAAGNDGQGVTGAAWNVSIMPVRVLGTNGSGLFTDILEGVRYAAGLPNRSGTVPPQRADIINLSLGSTGACPAAWQETVNSARAAGVLIVAAAGNEAAGQASTPANCAGVIGVAAVDGTRSRAPYSNAGPGVDIAAPGGNGAFDSDGDGYPDGVFSTHASYDGVTYYSSHTFLQGTSMAAPHVAGVIALMKSVNPALAPDEFDALLAGGLLTDDIGPPGADELGVGMVNALQAVHAALGGPPPAVPGQLNVLPTSVNFGDVTTSNEVLLSNSGTLAMSVTGVITSAAWLSASSLIVSSEGLGTYRIDVDRAGLAVGTYNGWVEFQADAGASVRTHVLMQVAESPYAADAGQQYVLLIDPETGDTLHQVEVLARGAAIDYAFTGIEHGQYELAAGTDLDNDGFICDEGEACAEYPVIARPEVLDVVGDVTDVMLTSGYRTNPASSASGAGRDMAGSAAGADGEVAGSAASAAGGKRTGAAFRRGWRRLR